MDRGIKAAELFLSGYNCAQAVAVAFCEEMGLTESQVARMVSPFGGGMGRMREVCGAVSGMLFVLGNLYGYDNSGDDAEKMQLYSQVQEMAAKFRAENGSIICRELLDDPPADPNPTPRTAEFYAQRPCARMVLTAARIMEEFLEQNPR